MPSQEKLDQLFMGIAYQVSSMSHDYERQVGAIIVKDGNVLSLGYNGMPAGMDNKCKSETGATKREVIHAEANAICKLARSTGSSEGATIYSTLTPCIECAKLILQSGIERVVFSEDYTDDTGKLLLLSKLKLDRIKYEGSTPISPGENKKS